MLKKEIMAAIALMAIHSPALAVNGYIPPPQNVSIDACDTITKGNGSAARGSIYDMAGFGTCNYSQVEACEYYGFDYKLGRYFVSKIKLGRCAVR